MLTAGEIVNRIKAVMAVEGVAWSDASTRDRFKFGGPDTVVTGVATTFMGTFEAITRASERGLNMIVTHEDTYWNDPDNTLVAEADPLVYRRKIEFMTQHEIVIFRIHDHMHRQRPDFTFSGTAREVGLDPATETAPNSHRFVIAETTLGELAARVKKIRGDAAIRVVGDPNAKVSRIAVGAGMATPAVNTFDVDVVIGGEQREIEGTFDSPEYVMDAAALGVPKGWIVLGHNMSEESGMQEMADWLRPIVPELHVQHVRAGIVYWAP
ncbi:MAG TPA: Nif3-like dinuclear metal center hexameric protein [Vicinamibacterales bacterium]